MARRRLQQSGELYEQKGWWKLRWREDVKTESGEVKRKWSKQVWIGPATGNQRLTEKQAKRIAWENFLSKLDQNNIVPQSVITLKGFVENHFKPEHVALKKAASRIFYRSLLDKHIVPALGEFRLRDITGAHVQRLVARKMSEQYTLTKDSPPQHYSPRTIQALVNSVSAVFTQAEHLEMFTGKNPAALVTLPELVAVRPKHALTLPAFQSVLSALPEPAYGLAFTSTLTSMNISEICGLKWRYVNLSAEWATVDGEALPPSTIAVRWQWAHGEYGTLKRKSRTRNIPLAGSLVSYLSELKARSKFPGPDDPVFAGRTGKPVDQHNEFNRRLKPITVKLGMPWVGWHTFRRTHTTLADQHAMSMTDRMAMMGHAAATMTAHYTDEDMTRRRAVLERIAGKLAVTEVAHG